MEGFLVPMAISFVVSLVVTFVIKTTRDANKLTPEERRRRSGGFDIDIDL